MNILSFLFSGFKIVEINIRSSDEVRAYFRISTSVSVVLISMLMLSVFLIYLTAARISGFLIPVLMHFVTWDD